MGESAVQVGQVRLVLGVFLDCDQDEGDGFEARNYDLVNRSFHILRVSIRDDDANLVIEFMLHSFGVHTGDDFVIVSRP